MAEDRRYNPNTVPPTPAALIDRQPDLVQTGLPPGGVTPQDGFPRPDGDIPIDRALVALVASLQGQGKAIGELLQYLARQDAARKGAPPLLGLTRLITVSSQVPQFPDGSPSPLMVDPWGHIKTASSAATRLGPTLSIPGGQTVSNPVWVQGVDEQPVGEPGTVLDPVNCARGMTIFDSAGRIAAETISLQVTADRVNWRDATINTTFTATLLTAAILNQAIIINCRGFRLRAAVAVGAGGLTFPTIMCV